MKLMMVISCISVLMFSINLNSYGLDDVTSVSKNGSVSTNIEVIGEEKDIELNEIQFTGITRYETKIYSKMSVRSKVVVSVKPRTRLLLGYGDKNFYAVNNSVNKGYVLKRFVITSRFYYDEVSSKFGHNVKEREDILDFVRRFNEEFLVGFSNIDGSIVPRLDFLNSMARRGIAEYSFLYSSTDNKGRYVNVGGDNIFYDELKDFFSLILLRAIFSGNIKIKINIYKPVYSRYGNMISNNTRLYTRLLLNTNNFNKDVMGKLFSNTTFLWSKVSSGIDYEDLFRKYPFS